VGLTSTVLTFGCVSSLCLIRITFFSTTVDLHYENIHGIPVVLSPYIGSSNESDRLSGLRYVRPISIANLKYACVFNILYYQIPLNYRDVFPSNKTDSSILNDWIYFKTRYSNKVFEKFLKPSYSLILFNGNMKIKNLERKIDFQLAQKMGVVYINRNNQSGFELLCKTADQVLIVHSLSTKNISGLVSLIELCFTRASGFVINLLGDQSPHANKFEVLQKPIQQMILEIFKFLNVPLIHSKKNVFPTISIGKIVFAGRSETLVMISSYELKMFTCYVDKFVSYYMYISAFDRTVWVMILVSGLLMNGLLYLHIRRNVPSAIEFSPLLFYFSTFTEESFNIPLPLVQTKFTELRFRFGSSFLLFSQTLT